MKSAKSLLLVLSALGAMALTSCEDGQIPSIPSEIVSSVTEEPSVDDSSSKPSLPEVVKYAIIDEVGDHISIHGAESAAEGETVTFRLGVETGYAFTGVIVVKDAEGTILDLVEEDGDYSFVMPGCDVTVSAEAAVASYLVSYHTPAELSLSAYEIVKETELATPERQAVAGVYTGTLEYYSYGYEDCGPLTITLGLDGSFHFVEAYSESNLDPRYESKGSYEVEKIDDNTYVVTFDTVTGNGVTVKGSMKIITTVVPASGEGEEFVPEHIERTFTASSSYCIEVSSYKYNSGSISATGEADALDPEKDVYRKLDQLPACWDYLDHFYVLPSKTNEYVAGSLSVDGEPVEANEDGYYRIDMPHHNASVSLTKTTRYSPIVTETDNPGLAVKAYIKVVDQEAGEETSEVYHYEEVTEAKYQEQVYFKAVDVEGAEVPYSLIGMTITYGPGSTDDITTNSSSLSVNEDGYYVSSWTKMSNMDFGMKVSFLANPKLPESEEHFSFGKALTGLSSYSSVKDFSVNEFGKVLFNGYEYYYTVDDISADGGVVTLHRYGYAESSDITAYRHGKTWAFLTDNSSTSFSYWAFGEAGVKAESEEEEDKVPSFSFLLDSSSSYSATMALVQITHADGTSSFHKIGDFDPETGIDEETGVNHDANSIAWDVGIEILNGKSSIADEGAIFDIKNGEEVLSTHINNSGVLASYVKGPRGTFVSATDTIVSDSVGGVTFNGAEVLSSAYGQTEEGGKTISFIAKVEDEVRIYNVVVDEEAGTFAPLAGKLYGTNILGVRRGGYYSTSAYINSSSYTVNFGSSTSEGTPTGETLLNVYIKIASTAYTGTYSINSDGEVVAHVRTSSWYDEYGDYIFDFSADGELALFHKKDSTTYYFYSTLATSSISSSNTQLLVSEFGSKKVFALVQKGSTTGITESSNVVIQDAAGMKFGTVTLTSESANWHTEGATFTLTVNGVTSGELSYVSGAIKANISGDYTVEGHENPVHIDNAGTITVDGTEYMFVLNDDGTLSYTVMDIQLEAEKIVHTTYTVTYDVDAKTATITEGSVRETGLFVCEDRGYLGGYPWTENEDGSWTSPSGHTSRAPWLQVTCYRAGTLTFTADISTEAKYDYLTIQTRGADDSTFTILDGYGSANREDNSGVRKVDVTIEVTAGMVVQIGYYKDGSGDVNDDRIIVKDMALA